MTQEWPKVSPSPSPPSILFKNTESEISYDSSLNYNSESDILIPSDLENSSSSSSDNDNDSEYFSDISGTIFYNHSETINELKLNRIRLGSISPPAPWGESPEPPLILNNLKKKKKTRWDEKTENNNINNNNNNINNVNKYDNILNNKNITLPPTIINNVYDGRNIVKSDNNVGSGAKIRNKEVITPLIVDDLLRPIDIHGNPIENNDGNGDGNNVNKILNENDTESTDKQQKNELFDPRLSTTTKYLRKSRPKAFEFVAQGTYTNKALALRAKAITKDLKLYKKNTKIDVVNAAKPDPNQFESIGLDWLDNVPNIEWWDKLLLNPKKFEKSIKNQYHNDYKLEMITDLIQNPKILRPELLSNELHELYNQASYLTKKEKKKIRRMDRKAKHNELQDKIRLGLVNPPEPKLKLSNIMRVLGNSSVIDPSAMEFKVRVQMEKRKMQHLNHNLKRKLDPIQKRLKKKKKLHEDTSREVHIGLFKIDKLNKKNKFKTQINAQQYNLTGCILILNNNFTMILVEGGQKGIKFYKNLLLNRIKWDINDDNNYCKLIWEGIVMKRNFQNFIIKSCDTQSELRKFLSLRKCAHYGDMICNNT